VQAGGAPAEPALVAPASATSSAAQPAGWAPEAERELNKIPFFVRGKARRNTERYAQERQLGQITIDTLYEAKAHFAR
jgi:light-independent protochlorophyllide reductase subunit B